MVTGYHRTPEGEQEYSKIGIPYEDSLDDVAYKRFLEITKICPKDKESKKRREILSLTRKVVGAAQKEFIIWSERHVAFDGIGNEKHFFRGSMGTYPIPIPIMELRQIPGTLQTETFVKGVREVKTGYSMPFTQKNADILYKDCVGGIDDEDINRAPTQFSIEVGNNRFTVDSFDSWKNGTVKELSGKIAQQQPQQQSTTTQPTTK
jgi:hypothetical protein